jgi:hypothetical protein
VGGLRDGAKEPHDARYVAYSWTGGGDPKIGKIQPLRSGVERHGRCTHASVAQWIEQLPSRPSGLSAVLTADLQVSGERDAHSYPLSSRATEGAEP